MSDMPNHRLAPALLVLALALSACGGGESGIASAPPPPIASPPPPPPAPPTEILAPARATTGAGPPAVLASSGGANFTSGPAAGTGFPLLQSALYLDWTISADTATMAAGATATVESGKIKASFPDGSDTIAESGHAYLDWTRVGYWAFDLEWRGAFIVGYQTPAGSVPVAGTATYSGVAEGSVFYPVSIGSSASKLTGGTASFIADFGLGRVTGSLTGLTADGSPWNDIAFTSGIAGNGFGGDTRVTSAPGGIASLATGATGTIEGRFFGPGAEEAGAVWTLYDGTRAAIGTLSGKRP